MCWSSMVYDFSCKEGIQKELHRSQKVIPVTSAQQQN